ncbi:hypothetical protein Dgeo_2562 (plasmid) [Deinococcus geothermalis DSM 11300]|uniref:Uncharacterized protein n=1 Tax=Deinococcus geothermalis (strain DSM 11300 / CIP 105573 / AG-3a) TaxID=319795 RepID=Q1J3D8_DEIGD|nr:hypothetical protein Dgeo_2562 [Deinococcus geothermalis DSM 11300]
MTFTWFSHKQRSQRIFTEGCHGEGAHPPVWPDDLRPGQGSDRPKPCSTSGGMQTHIAPTRTPPLTAIGGHCSPTQR